ncbi:MAG: copper resistance protein CopC [Chloroflexota bacterium]
MLPRRGRAWLAAWIAFAALLLPVLPVQGHAELLSSTPAANSSLFESPTELVLTFTESIDSGTASVELIDAGLRTIPGLGATAVNAADDEVSATLPTLEPGVYTVEWSVVSALDGHQTSGLFAFAVDPTGANPPPSRSSQSSAPTADAAAVAARWVALGGGVMLLGIALFWLLSALPAMRGVPNAPDVPFGMLAAAALTALVGIALYVTLAARGLESPSGGFPLDPAAPFGATPFATAVRISLIATLLALVVAIAAGGRLVRRARPALIAISVAALVALAAFSVAGHALSLGGPLNGVLDWLHLVGVAAWVGALPALLGLATAGRDASTRPVTLAALRRHALVALPAAPLVAVTGLLNTPAVIGPVRDLVGSAYGNLVLGKALLFSVIVGIGAANWLVLRGGSPRAARWLMASEAAAAGLAILVAATMVTVAPAASRLPVTAPSGLGAAQLYGTAGDTIVHLAVIRPLPGDQRYEVVTRNAADGAPRLDVQKVFLAFSAPPDSGLPEQRIELTASEQPWLWATRGAYTPVVGAWDVEVVVRRAGELDERVDFPLRVTDVVPPATLAPPDDGLAAPSALEVLWRIIPAAPGSIIVALVPLLGGAALVLHRRGRARRSLRLAAGALLLAGLVAGIGVVSRSVVEIANAAPAVRASAFNPVASDAASLARGDALYRANCSSCHGLAGGGDGPSAASPIGDLAFQVPGRSDGELSWIIERGMAGTQMPGFALTLSEQDRWDLINHLRSAFGPAAR